MEVAAPDVIMAVELRGVPPPIDVLVAGLLSAWSPKLLAQSDYGQKDL